MMQNISRKMVDVADLPMKLDLQLFAEEDDTPNLENTPEFKDDAKEFNAKMEKYVQDRPVKPSENEPVQVDEVVKPEVVEPGKPKQDSETNKAFQEMRQKLETAEKERTDIAAKAKKADDLIAAQFGKQGITTVEQYEQWIRQGEEEANAERYEAAGLTPEEIEKLRKYDELQRLTVNDEAQRVQLENNQRWNQLYTAYPDIVESAQLFNEGKEPEWYNDEMKREIARGASPLAAYRNAHFETILANATKGTKEAAKQEALNSINSKSHIKANGTDGADVDHVEIDDETMRMYRALNKGKTDSQIRAWHKKHA